MMKLVLITIVSVMYSLDLDACHADDSPTEIRRLTGFVAPVAEIVISPDRKKLATASGGRTTAGAKFGDARVWDIQTGRTLIKVADEPNIEIWSVAFHPNGLQFVSLGLRGDEHLGLVSETETGKKIADICTGDVRIAADIVTAQGGKHVITILPNRVLVADALTGLEVPATGKEVRPSGDEVLANSMAVSADERMVASEVNLKGSSSVQVWNLSTGQRLMTTEKTNWVEQIQFSTDNRRMAFGSFQSAELWNLETFQRVAKLGNENRCAFSPSGKLLLTSNPSGLLSVWDASTGERKLTFQGHEHHVSSVAFLPNGQVLCAGGVNRKDEIGTLSSSFDIYQWKLPDSLSSLATSAETAVASKPIAPNRDESLAARREIREIFQTEFSSAKTPELKSELSRSLFDHAAQADTVLSRFAFLEEAYELATAAGDIEGTKLTMDELSAFDGVDIGSMQVEAIRTFAGQEIDRNNVKPLGEFCFLIMEQLASVERYEAALSVAKSGNTIATKSKDGELRKLLKIRQDRLEWMHKLHDAAVAARETLNTSPDDAKAKGNLGRYLCLVRQDWEAGLTHLAASDDAKLKAIAFADKGTSADVTGQVETADAWFHLATSAKGADRAAMFRRAKHWYELAVSSATGLAKVRVEKRLEEINKALNADGWDAPAKAPAHIRASVDLRPEFERRGLAVRQQGGRGSCQVFAFVGPIEFQIARPGRPSDLSEQFLMWAANDTCDIDRLEGHNPDHLIRGLQDHGICVEPLMPYVPRKEPLGEPSPKAIQDAAKRTNFELTSIKHWQSDIGFDSEQMQSLMRTLDAERLPVTVTLCWPSGLADEQIVDSRNVLLDRQVDGTNKSGHGVVLVGYLQAPSFPGGGYFIVRNSWGNKFAENGYVAVTFDYAKRYGIDAYVVKIK